jgi:SAM-dependent methyltransferase
MRSFLFGLGCLMSVLHPTAGRAEENVPGHGHAHSHVHAHRDERPHGGSPSQHGGRHGNPEDLAAYVARLEDPGRDAWQLPAQVVEALSLRPGQTVCDVGAGPGYFSLRLGAAVGPKGIVYAVDVEPPILEALRTRLEQKGVLNVTPVLGLPGDPLLPRGACDLVVIVNTYHHFADGSAYLRRLGEALRPGGRVVNIDFEQRDTPVGPPLEHRVSKEAFVADAKRAGFDLLESPGFLPHQYFVVLKPARP